MSECNHWIRNGKTWVFSPSSIIGVTWTQHGLLIGQNRDDMLYIKLSPQIVPHAKKGF